MTGGANAKQSTQGHPSRPGARLEVRTAADHLRLRGPDAGVPALRPQVGRRWHSERGDREPPGAAGPPRPRRSVQRGLGPPRLASPPRPSATHSLRALPARPALNHAAASTDSAVRLRTRKAPGAALAFASFREQ